MTAVPGFGDLNDDGIDDLVTLAEAVSFTNFSMKSNNVWSSSLTYHADGSHYAIHVFYGQSE